MTELTRMTDRQRRGLQIGGVACTGLGLVVFVLGPVSAVWSLLGAGPDTGDFATAAGRSFAWFIGLGFLGFVLIVAGGSMVRFGFMKPVAELTATETGNAIEHAGQRAGSGLGLGLARAGRAGTGVAVELVKIKCRSCGYLESEDARFCSGCGRAV